MAFDEYNRYLLLKSTDEHFNFSSTLQKYVLRASKWHVSVV